VIGALDDADAHHSAAIESIAVRGDDDLRLPASAYSEALVVPERLGRVDAVKLDLANLALEVEPIGAETAEVAARVRARHPSLRLPDALVLAHAEVIDADELLTTDTRWKRFSRRVTVVG
jgi:predicted nucleic acid-binding protein